MHYYYYIYIYIKYEINPKNSNNSRTINNKSQIVLKFVMKRLIFYAENYFFTNVTFGGEVPYFMKI